MTSNSLKFSTNEGKPSSSNEQSSSSNEPFRTSSANRSGFTLIELLITLSLVAILSAIGVASYQVVNKNARDSKRLSDLKVIQSALEQYHSDNFHYPIPLNTQGPNCTSGTFKIGCPLTNSNTQNMKTYLSKIPGNIEGATNYKYVSHKLSSDDSFAVCDTDEALCNRYCLYTNLENLNNQVKPVQCTDSLYNFAVITP